jgi:hypothetical protein
VSSFPLVWSESHQGFGVVINAGVLIPTGMAGIPPVFTVVIPAGVFPAGLLHLNPSYSTTCHGLLIKIRNNFVPTSGQLMPKHQQDTPTIYNHSLIHRQKCNFGRQGR